VKRIRKPGYYPCDLCPFVSKKKDHLQVHRRNVHSESDDTYIKPDSSPSAFGMNQNNYQCDENSGANHHSLLHRSEEQSLQRTESTALSTSLQPKLGQTTVEIKEDRSDELNCNGHSGMKPKEDRMLEQVDVIGNKEGTSVTNSVALKHSLFSVLNENIIKSDENNGQDMEFPDSPAESFFVEDDDNSHVNSAPSVQESEKQAEEQEEEENEDADSLHDDELDDFLESHLKTEIASDDESDDGKYISFLDREYVKQELEDGEDVKESKAEFLVSNELKIESADKLGGEENINCKPQSKYATNVIYSEEFKSKCLDLADEIGYYKAAKTFHVCKETVKRWVNQKKGIAPKKYPRKTASQKKKVEMKLEANDDEASDMGDGSGWDNEAEITSAEVLGKKSYSCERCQKSFLFEDTLVRHNREVHGRSKPHLNCQECGQAFLTVNKLEIHKRKHMGLKPFKCKKPECNEYFQDHVQAMIHFNKCHLGAEMQCSDGDFKCHICAQVMSSSRSLMYHISSKHSAESLLEGNTVHECHICSKVFDEDSVLKNHLRKSHNIGTESLTCEICGREFMSRTSLKNHLNYHEIHPSGQENVFQCNFCEKLFSHNTTLSKHLKTHRSGLRDIHIKCHDCEITFALRDDLLKHIETHHKLESSDAPDHKCNLCEKTFKIPRHLSDHLKEHYPSSEDLKCRECGTQFTSRNGYNLHFKIAHLGERKYVCPDCGKAFTRSSNLKVHQLIHTGELPFKCEHCNQGYKEKRNLLKHIERQHVH